ncbi:hypothetical protein PQU92_02765 [Asticcacaulis sp. BYS171W]|uniref:Uncharacterized protein n=1 Tax=Asticcacaulis aquaticus TaxID=2984212 RepID=A0ABT5HQ36_9CAUL|nr:hypothetical protein [Asticcacaulis aquaticus]MDC7682180.1 hypothetical protein [Asticcacaulis aquaticus]
MSLNPEPFRLYQQRLTAVIAAVQASPEPIVQGRACAVGTLTSMANRVNKLLEAWETRGMTNVDRNDVVRDDSTLRWLKDDHWVYQDFADAFFDLPDAPSPLTFREAMDALIASQQASVAESAV